MLKKPYFAYRVTSNEKYRVGDWRIGVVSTIVQSSEFLRAYFKQKIFVNFARLKFASYVAIRVI